MTKRTTAAKSTRKTRTSTTRRHEPPSIAEMAFQVVKRGREYYVVNEHQVVVAGPLKSREAAQAISDQMQTRAPR
jgi:hypothetical protein